MICVGVDGRVPGQPNPAPAAISGLLVLSQRATVESEEIVDRAAFHITDLGEF
jgi:hypothetical protein